MKFQWLSVIAMASSVAFVGGCCNGDKAGLTGKPVFQSLPPVVVAAKRPRVDSAAGSKSLNAVKDGRVLLAYVSPSRRKAWATQNAVNEAKAGVKHEMEWTVVSSEELSSIPTKFTPVEGDMQWWDNAECASGVMSCVDDCVPVGNGVYRHATTFNSTACVVGSGRCWDNLQKRCTLRFYSDSSCTKEIPDSEGAFYDWVCGGP